MTRHEFRGIALGVAMAASPMALASMALAPAAHAAGSAPNPFADAPAGFVPPPLDPSQTDLVTQQLSDGVYALLATRLPVDNSGFIVGEDGVLVIDAHINPTMATKIIDAVREVTDKPILYLVNTNFHGDHTFGNATFPAETTIIAHSQTQRHMARYFEAEKALILQTVGGNAEIIADVSLRLADITFEDHLRIDLGGRVVDIYHFGQANTAGDTVVYSAAGRVAWTGNFVVGEQLIPPIFEPVTRAYLASVAAFADTLDVATIVPGHGRPTDGRMLTRYQDYLSELLDGVSAQIAAGNDLAATLEALPLPDKWVPASGTPEVAALPLIGGFHKLNVQRTYQELTGVNAGG